MTVITLQFRSKMLAGRTHLSVLIPTDLQVEGGQKYLLRPPYRTLYLLHGLHGCEQDWLMQTLIVRYAQKWGLCVVMPQGDNRWYASTPDLMEDYQGFVSDELIQFTRRTFPLSEKREDTYIGGLSMGGYGAILTALNCPHTFAGCIALSSAIRTKEFSNAPEEGPGNPLTKAQVETIFGLDDAKAYAGSRWDVGALAEQHAHDDPKPRFFLACGTDDGLYQPNVAYRDQLVRLGYECAWDDMPGGHAWDVWDAEIQKGIAWAYGRETNP